MSLVGPDPGEEVGRSSVGRGVGRKAHAASLDSPGRHTDDSPTVAGRAVHRAAAVALSTIMRLFAYRNMEYGII